MELVGVGRGITGTPNVSVTNAVQIDDSTPIMVDHGDTVLPSEIVSLSLSTGSCSVFGLIRLLSTNPDGRLDADPFLVPAGQVLVLTSMQYLITGASAGRQVELSLHWSDGLNATSMMVSGSIANGSGESIGNETFPTGIVFGPGIEPCVFVAGVGSPVISKLSAQGYLVPNNYTTPDTSPRASGQPGARGVFGIY